MCFLAGFKRKNIKDAKKPGMFLSLESFRKIIDEIAEVILTIDTRKPFSVNLTGGETFLHPEIFSFLAYAQKKDVGLTIFTNGTLIGKDIAKKIVEHRPEVLIFSLDGIEQDHDRVRGVGNFRKTYDAIKFIQEEKIRQNAKEPRIFINSIINDFSVEHIEEFVSFCEKLKADRLFFSHIQWSNSEITSKTLKELESRLEWTAPLSKMVMAMEHNLSLSKEKIPSLLEKIKKTKDDNLGRDSVRIDFMPDLLPDEINLWYSSKSYRIDYCQDVRNWIRIGVTGDVYPICPFVPFPWGNVQNKSIRQIFSGDRAKAFFVELRERGFFYACHRCCRRPSQSECILE
jgi:MoaA/NifB/PqqE/SkfB family radical SAM enzyme